MKKILLALTLCSVFVLSFANLAVGQIPSIYPLPIFLEKAIFEKWLELKELSAAPSHLSGYGKVYVLAANGHLYYKDASGSATDITAGALGGTTTTVMEGGSPVNGSDIVTLDFLAADFIVGEDPNTEVNIAIDYANGQEATTDQTGFLNDTDWDTFNGKQAADNALTNLSGLTYASPSILKFTADDAYTVRTLAEIAGDLESEIEADIDTLANLTSIQGQTFTLAGAFVTQNNDVTINAAGAARTLTLNANSALNQDLENTDDVQFADIHHTKFISTVYYNCGNSGASITIDWNNGNLQYVTLDNAAVDVTFTEPPNPGHCELWIIQDGSGSRTIDWEHEVSPKWPGDVEPTLSTGAGDIDVIVFTFIGGTTYRGLFNGNFE